MRRVGGLFFSCIKRDSINGPLAVLCGEEGIDEKMRRADQALVHGCSRLDGQQFTDQRLVETAAKLGQGFGQYTVGLRTVELDVFSTTGIHDRHVGPPPFTDYSIGGAPFVFEQLQRATHVSESGGDRGENVWANAWQCFARWPRP
jgi:hypothetical protein